MKYIAYTLAFLTEIICWCSLAWIGSLVSDKATHQWSFMLILFLIIITFWGFFMSPKAPKRLKLPFFYLIKMVLYSGALLILWHHDQRWALGFLMLIIISEPFIFKDERTLSK